MADDDNGFAFMLVSYTIKSRPCSQYEFYPGLGTWRYTEKGFLLKCDGAELCSKFPFAHIQSFARAFFLHFIIKDDG